MFFILSSGRSGSQTIAEVLNSYSNCVCCHEPEPALVLESTLYYYGEYSGEKIANVLRSTRPMDSRKRVYGEANLQFSLIVPIIEQVFPGAKYIWLLRDGRDVVASMYYRRWYDSDDTKVPPVWKEARLQGDRVGDFSSLEWEKMNRFARCCWLWKKYNLIIESHLNKIEQLRWMKVRLDKCKAMLPEIEKFLGLYSKRKVFVERLNVAYQPIIYWNGWDDETRKTFELLCGDEMDRWFPEWRTDKGIWQKIETETPDRTPLLLQTKRWIKSLPSKARWKAGDFKRRILNVM